MSVIILRKLPPLVVGHVLVQVPLSGYLSQSEKSTVINTYQENISALLVAVLVLQFNTEQPQRMKSLHCSFLCQVFFQIMIYHENSPN